MSQSHKTARCLLVCEHRVLLAIHSKFWGAKHQKWGIPGGGINRNESPEAAARREVWEELSLELGGLTDLGAFSYNQARHRVFGATTSHMVTDFDDRELIDIAWFTRDEVATLATSDGLHAGYELAALDDYLAILRNV